MSEELNRKKRIANLAGLWKVENYNPWHDELGRFTFSGMGLFVAPSNLVPFNVAKALRKSPGGNMIDYSKVTGYNPDKAAATAVKYYTDGVSADINRNLRAARNATDANKMLVNLNKPIPVPHESGNYIYTSTAIRNVSRTIAFQTDKDMEVYRGVAGDTYAKMKKGQVVDVSDFFSSSVSDGVAEYYAARRASQTGSSVSTIIRVQVPAGTAIGLPTATKNAAGLSSVQSDEGEVIFSPSSRQQIVNVGPIQTKTIGGKTVQVREVVVKILPRKSAAEQLEEGTYGKK